MSIPDVMDLLRRSVEAHRGGDLRLAELGYRDVLAAVPGQADATHYLGMIAYQRGDLAGALELVREAARRRPEDVSVLSNLGLVLLAAQRAVEAAETLERALAIDRALPEAWHNLALARSRQGRADAARDALEQCLALAPGHAQARRGLASLHVAAGRPADAVACLEAGRRLAPGDPRLALELGQALELDRRPRAALEVYGDAADDPGTAAEARVRASIVYRGLAMPGSALVTARGAVLADPGAPACHRALGQALKELGRLEDAARAFRRGHTLNRRPGTPPDPARRDLAHCSKAKLRHDIEQLGHLADRGIAVPHSGHMIRGYGEALARLPATLPEGRVAPLPAASARELAPYYNRCHYLRDTPATPGPAVAGLDAEAVTADYRARAPGITWIDGFLTPEALQSLRAFCLESTIWYDFEHPGGYLGAYLQEGFNCPLLLQIARELPAALPGIFGDHVLMQMWAYKYDSRLSGIDMHADFAAINVNFWLTPTSASLDPEGGGMVVWDTEAPGDWGKDDYNTYDPERQRRIRDYLAARGARRIVIPHCQNRCVIFNSDLFHRTDDIRFRDGYENRRINVTMLYGLREPGRRGRAPA